MTELFPNVGVSGKALDSMDETWIFEGMNSFFAPLLVFCIWTALWAFTNFPCVLFAFPDSLNSWSVCLSVSFFLSPQRCACLLSALLASFPSSACESLSAGCRYITSIFLESLPSLPVSEGSLSHYFFLSSASKANGDRELSMLFVHSHHEKSSPMAFTLCNGKAGKNLVLYGLKPTVADAELVWNFQLQAKRGKSAGHT